MTPTQLYVLIGLSAYISILLFIGWRASRSETHEGFVIGARNVGVMPTMGSLASSFRDGGGVLTWIAFGFTSGYGGLWLAFGVTAALLVVALFGPRVRRIAKERDYITVGQMLRDSIGPRTARMLSAIILIICLVVVALQLYVSGNLLSRIAEVPEWGGVLMTAVIVGFYLFTGGYGTVVKTDFLQFFLILSLILSPLFFTPRLEEVTDFSSLFTLPEGVSADAFFWIGTLFVLGSADAWQRLFSARDDKVIRIAFPLAGPGFILMTLSLFFLGMASKTVLSEVPEGNTILFALYTSGQVSPAILAFIAVVVIAISMSTLDTFSYLFSATLLKDFMKQDFRIHRDGYIRRSRIIITLLLLLMSLAALNVTDGVKFLFDSVSAVYTLVPVFVFTGFGLMYPSKNLDRAVATALGLSILLYLYMFLGGVYADRHIRWTLIPGAMSVGLVLISMLLFNRRSNQHKVSGPQKQESGAP